MRATRSCHTCLFNDWEATSGPCTECSGFINWRSKTPDKVDEIKIHCPNCGETKMAPRKCPLTGYEYNTGWVTRCPVCNDSMAKVITEV